MGRSAAVLAIMAMSSLQSASAMMAPKFERVRVLSLALQHLVDISYMLRDPIDKIEYVGGEVRFDAGQCSVAVAITYQPGLDESGRPVLGGGSYSAQVGQVHCA